MHRSLALLPSHGSPNGAPILDGARAPARPLLGVALPTWADAAVTKHLKVYADHGLTLTRPVLGWPDLMPAPDRLDDTLLDRFGNFLDLHLSLGLRAMPALLAGNASGPAWRKRRDRYGDVWLVGQQAWLAEQMARRFGGHPAVAGWLVSGEARNYPGPGTPEAVRSWAQLVIQGLRAGGATEPVSLAESGCCVDLVDWIGARPHPAGDDQAGPHLRAAFQCELASTAGRPVLLEELSLRYPASYYRQVLHTTLLAGATGWIAGAPAEPDEVPDDALRAMAAFRAVLDEVGLHRCIRVPAAVCVVLPSHVDTRYPFTDPREQPAALGAIEHAYLACRRAGVPPGLARESQGIGADCLLYVLPSVKQLTAPGWRRLEDLAHGGATVYVSYFAGATDYQPGPWYTDADRIFGVRHQLRYGLPDPIGAEPVRLTLRDDVGNLTAGTELCFATGTDPARRAYLPVEPIEAQVLATDQAGRPALLHRPVGAGAIMFSCYPFEAMAATAPPGGADDTWRLYAALAHAAGAHPVVRVDEPRVLVDCLDRDDGTRFVWLVSDAATPLTVTARTHTGIPLRDLRSGAPASTVEIPPSGVRVLRT